MGWVTLDDNFPSHPKTISSGPLAAYLYVCGLCYCRKYHTGGFIPAAAVKTLGVTTNPRKLVESLMQSGFWLKADGGFQVHDYAAIYPDDKAQKEQSEARRQQKRDAGKKGGRASWLKRSAEADVQADGQAESKQPASNGAEALRGGVGVGVVASVVSEERKVRDDDPRMDLWWAHVLQHYPEGRRTRGVIAQHAFIDQMLTFPDGPLAAWALFEANLAANVVSHEWRVKGMAPMLLKYLNEERWKDRLPAEPPAAERLSKSTQGTLVGANEYLEEKRRGA